MILSSSSAAMGAVESPQEVRTAHSMQATWQLTDIVHWLCIVSWSLHSYNLPSIISSFWCVFGVSVLNAPLVPLACWLIRSLPHPRSLSVMWRLSQVVTLSACPQCRGSGHLPTCSQKWTASREQHPNASEWDRDQHRNLIYAPLVEEMSNRLILWEWNVVQT